MDDKSDGTLGLTKTNIYGKSYIDFDPVMEQSRKDTTSLKSKSKHKESRKEDEVSIRPSLSIRVGLQSVPTTPEPGVKYKPPKTKKQRRAEAERRKELEATLGFCQYDALRMPSRISANILDIRLEAPSAEIKDAKVFPRKPSVSPSDVYPRPPKKKELRLKKPKSGVIINETFSKPARKHRKRQFSKRKPPTNKDAPKSGSTLQELSGMSPVTIEELVAQELATIEEMGEQENDEEKVIVESFLTKMFRKHVSQISKTTSINSKDLKMDENVSQDLEEDTVSRIIQKFRRDSEQDRYEKTKPRSKLKKSLLRGLSLTKLKQPLLKYFYFGVKQGTFHQGDEHFPITTRNKQGICMPIAAYCLSILKHPDTWTTVDVDDALEAGNRLCLDSANKHHLHGGDRELLVSELHRFCHIDNKKIQFELSEPEVSGMIRSDDKKIYNITKALGVFFSRHSAGILQTDEINIALWKDKHYYFFDAAPRSIDLFSTEHGTALMAHFYDIPSVTTILLTRSGLGNPAFVMYPIKTYKILSEDAEEVDSKEAIQERDNYQILNQNKAVVLGSFDLADKCFGFSRNKQALAVAVVALVYSKISPASSWHKTTVDKIVIIGNQLFLECVCSDEMVEMKLDDLPAIFTIGPYLVEIYIYSNRFADLLYRKGKCTLQDTLERFFEKNTNAIVQIDKFILAIWRQRNMYHCFDPYSRDNEGLKTRNGAACTSMHSNLESLVETISSNFDSKDMIYYIHSMKVCKIHRDPNLSHVFPKSMTMKEYPVEAFKQVKMRKTRRSATCKPVTVDYTHNATLTGEAPQDSIMEVGSNIQSLAMDQIPPMVHKFPSKAAIKNKLLDDDYIADLDSPSLSDTQIEPPPPEQPDGESVIDFVDLGSLTQEELELHARGEGGEGGEGGESKQTTKSAQLSAAIEEENRMIRESGEGEDWYMAAADFTQIGSHSLLSGKISEEVNTDLTFFTIPKEELVPPVRPDILRQKKKARSKADDTWVTQFDPEPDVTQSEELRKPTNFIDLPDDSQIVLGSKNMSDFGDNLEFMAPFVCMMAAVVSKKYAIISWNKDICDYILERGADLYKASDIRYDQAYKLEIQKICLGKDEFAIQVKYVFDAYIKRRILEMALTKILFCKANMGVLVTPSYACCLFLKNRLYYLFDGFGSNEVGLGTGPDNKGVATLARFKNVHSLVLRILHNKNKRETKESIEYNRFVLSTCVVKQLRKSPEADEEEEELMAGTGEDTIYEDRPQIKEVTVKDEVVEEDHKEETAEPKNKVGYQWADGLFKIEGTKALAPRQDSETLKADYFVSLYACLMSLSVPVKKWDTKTVDLVLEEGDCLYNQTEDLKPCLKKTISNILIEKYLVNVVVKRFQFASWGANRHLRAGIETMIARKHENFMVQLPHRTYVINLAEGIFHLFDPSHQSGKASWTKYTELRSLIRRINATVRPGREHDYNFHVFEVTGIVKAPKNLTISTRLQHHKPHKEPKHELVGKPFYEHTFWLDVEPIPWGKTWVKEESPKWHEWNVEFPDDLFSLFGNMHQKSDRFSQESRGKQTLSNLVVAIAMIEIYELAEWTSAVMDAILVNGDNYFRECVKDITDEDYEVSVDDMKAECSIFPYSFGVVFTPVVEGTMFLVRMQQFNLYKALRFFFDDYERRNGIVVVTMGSKKRQVAFGKTQEAEYFMYDCEAVGPPMFIKDKEVSYVLRTTNLNRLLHILVLTLRGGDFYIFEVGISELKPMV